MAGKGAELADEWKAILDEAGVEPAAPPQHAAIPAATAAFGQGVSGGWTDELGAGVDTAISKIPGVRNLAESLNSMGGGHPGLSPLTQDMSYQQRVDEYRNRNDQMRQQHPAASFAGSLAGTTAQAFAPGIGAASAPTAAGTALSGAAQGAGAGMGFNEKPETMARDTLLGAGTGAVAGAMGGAAQKFAAGAPVRNEARQLNEFGVTPKTAGKAQARGGTIASRSDDVINLLRKSPEIKAAAGDPGKVVAAVDKSLQPLTARTQALYQAADASTKLGGMEQPQLLGPLNQALAKAEGSGADIAYVNRLRRVIDQVRSLAVPVQGVPVQKGSQATVIPTAKLRQFITDKLAPTTHESETGAAQAVDDAAVVLKDALHGFVGKQSGNAAKAELQALDKDVSTHLILKEAAARQFDKTRYSAPTPKPVDAAKRAAGAGVDAVLGAGGSRPARTLEEGTRRLTVQRFLDHVDADDPDRAKQALVEGIYGQ